MPKIITFLTYADRAEEAARFYVSIFPNSKIREITHYPAGAPVPEGSVMTVTFELDGREFVALNGGPGFRFSEGISLSVQCKDQAEVDRYWEALSEGGEKGPCGWLTDRFGVSWQVNPTILLEMISDADRGQAERALHAMMQMSKIDVAALERAYAGK